MTHSGESNIDRLVAAYEHAVDELGNATGPVSAREWAEAATSIAGAIEAAVNAGHPKRAAERLSGLDKGDSA